MVTIPVSLTNCSLPKTNNADTAEKTPTDPASIITAAGKQIADAYRRYDELRALTSLLNGLRPEEPFPENVQIRELVVEFTANGQTKTASVRTVNRVGDLSELLLRETDTLIRTIVNQARAARENAAAIEEACERSLNAFKPAPIV